MPDRSAYVEDPRIVRVLFTEAEIRARIEELASQITNDCRDVSQLHLVGILNGAFVFLADLGRELRRAGAPPAAYAFAKVRAYGQNIRMDGEPVPNVDVELMPDGLRGKDILLVDDILDQGSTLAEIRRRLLEEEEARSVRVCVLLRKDLDNPSPQARKQRQAAAVDYVGLDVPDEWVVGYGLDAAGEFRDLPCIAVVRGEDFRPA